MFLERISKTGHAASKQWHGHLAWATACLRNVSEFNPFFNPFEFHESKWLT
jgi:hypothetical protein